MSATASAATTAAWEPVIGLEIHVQLKTKTKLFCRCALGWAEEENTRTCPVCLGHPGALPVANRRAIEWTIRIGLALGCTIADRSIFARKNYFYPDLPKGYQISQFDLPSCVDGTFLVPGADSDGDREIAIVRAHLEEDAAKTVHVGGAGGRIHGAERSLVDFNRGGTPLVEIVTGPDIRSADEARRFLQLLRQTVVELGVSDAELEKGSLRCDANVSVRRVGETGFRTKAELKNMNSFKFVADGIDAEIARQIEIYESGGEVRQETLHYDPTSGRITPLRSKEDSDDYRYFPEPDLVPVEPDAATVAAQRAEVGESPGARIVRLRETLGFETASGLVTSGRDRLYDRVVAAGADPRAAANVVMNQLAQAGVAPDAVDPAELAKLIEARDRMPREALLEALARAGDPGFRADDVIAGSALVTTIDALLPIIEKVYDESPKQIESFKSGKDGLRGYLVGQTMKGTSGRADPELVAGRWSRLIHDVNEASLLAAGVPSEDVGRVIRRLDMALIVKARWRVFLEGKELVFKTLLGELLEDRIPLDRVVGLGVWNQQDIIAWLTQLERSQASADASGVDRCPSCWVRVEALVSYSFGAAAPGAELREPDTQSTRCPASGVRLRRTVASPWMLA